MSSICMVLFKYLTTLFAAHKWLFLGSALYLLSWLTIKVMFSLVLQARYMSLPMKHWYSQSSVFSWSFGLVISIAEPVFMGITLALYFLSPFSMTRSLINADWSIFIVCAAGSLMICHPMIVFTSLRFFISYFLPSSFFNALKMAIAFNTRRKLSTYILTMLTSLLICQIKMLESPFSCLNLMFL